MKEIKSKNLIVGKRYCTPENTDCILEFVKYDKTNDPLFKQIKGNFSEHNKLVPFFANFHTFIEL